MIEALTALLIEYFATRSQAPVSDDDRARLAVIARANVEECEANPIPGWPTKACIALATNTQMWESGLLADVHAGARVGPAGERCLMQLHRTVTAIPAAKHRITRDEWEHTIGTDLDSTRTCVRLGMRAIRWHVARCGLRYEGGGWYIVAKLYAEYHRPTARCSVAFGRMSERRGVAYTALLYKIGKMETGTRSPAP